MKVNSIDKKVIHKIVSSFTKKRIKCLLRYGPTKKVDGKPPIDFDYLLLLDKYQDDDYLTLSSIRRLNLSIEIFIDYLSHIYIKGISNYQRGCHGSYFINILASAHTLYGKNFYAEFTDKINRRKTKLDLCFRIEEYFYRIQKEIINSRNQDNYTINKYLGRIITDILLLDEKLMFSDINKYHYSTIMSMMNTFDTFNKSNITNLLKIFQTDHKPNIPVIGTIIKILYSKYFRIRRYHKL